MCLLTKLKQKKSDARKTTTANSSKKIKLVKVRLKKKICSYFQRKNQDNYRNEEKYRDR